MNGCKWEHEDTQCHHPDNFTEPGYIDWCCEGMCEKKEKDEEEEE